MSGFFGCISRNECVNDVFYGTDYHSHLGTKRAGMAFFNGKAFVRSIHSLENGYFRNKFEDELPRFGDSQMGIGVISDNESQPITITSHLGRYAVVTVARIENIEELTEKMLSQRMHFAELSSSEINATELVAMLIGMGNSIKEGIEYVQNNVKGSCSMLVLTDHAIYAARDKFGRTPISIGKNDKGYVCASESSSYANLGYSFVRDLGPGEIVEITAEITVICKVVAKLTIVAPNIISDIFVFLPISTVQFIKTSAPFIININPIKNNIIVVNILIPPYTNKYSIDKYICNCFSFN